jgi:hypothetical protein
MVTLSIILVETFSIDTIGFKMTKVLTNDKLKFVNPRNLPLYEVC